MKNRSKKNKGLRLENHLVDILREQLDKDAYRVAASGAGLDKNDIRLPNMNVEIEAKNANRFGLKSGLDQMERQRTDGNIPILAMRHPDYSEFEKVVVAMELGDLIELLSRDKDIEVSKELPDDLKWDAKNAKDAAHKLFKALNEYKNING